MPASLVDVSTLSRPRSLFARLLGAWWLIAFATTASAGDTWVITDTAHPVTGDVARLILLDAPERFEADLSAGLPVDPSQAAVLAQQRMKQGGADLQRRLGAAYQGVTDSRGLGVAKIPAVVVDHRYVVYGESNVASAVARINAYRSAHP